jgi:hypothetical protein
MECGLDIYISVEEWSQVAILRVLISDKLFIIKQLLGEWRRAPEILTRTPNCKEFRWLNI